MDAVEFLKAKKRMCKKAGYCQNCEVGKRKRMHRLGCTDYCVMFPDEVVEIVQEWAMKYPAKTIAEDFFEKFPRAPKDEGIPKLCAKHCGYVDDCPGGVTCNECWIRPLEGEK